MLCTASDRSLLALPGALTRYKRCRENGSSMHIEPDEAEQFMAINPVSSSTATHAAGERGEFFTGSEKMKDAS